MPSIMDGCILILSKAGTGTAMFSMGENGILSRLFRYIPQHEENLGLMLINECMRMCRDVHGTAGEIDSMWAELDRVRDGFEVHCWSGGHGHRFYCLGLAW